jgi:DHA1 family tetracycline resistance protein-like MFS transporter
MVRTATPSKEPLLNRQLRLFLVGMVLANIGGNMYATLLPLYLTELQANVIQVGLFFTLSRILPLALQILGGWLSDSIGRLRSIAIGSIAGVLSYLGLIVAPTWQWVLLGEGLGAVTRSLIGPSFPAFIAEQSSEETRARVFGRAQAIFGIVSIIGPPFGGFLADTYSFKSMLICAGLLYTAAAVIRVSMALAAASGSEAGLARPSLAGLRANLGTIAGMALAGGVFTWILITDGVGDISFSLSYDLMPLYMERFGGLSGQQIGWLFSLFGLFRIIANTISGWLADRRGERASIGLGFLLNFLGYAAFVQVQGFWGFGASSALFGLGVGMMEPAYQSFTSKVVPERLRGTAFGLVRSSLGIFSLPAPAIGAQLWERFSPLLPFLLTGWATLASVIPVWLRFKPPAKSKHPVETRPPSL